MLSRSLNFQILVFRDPAQHLLNTVWSYWCPQNHPWLLLCKILTLRAKQVLVNKTSTFVAELMTGWIWLCVYSKTSPSHNTAFWSGLWGYWRCIWKTSAFQKAGGFWTCQPLGIAQAVQNSQNGSKGATGNDPFVMETHVVCQHSHLVQYHLLPVQQDTRLSRNIKSPEDNWNAFRARGLWPQNSFWRNNCCWSTWSYLSFHFIPWIWQPFLLPK